jgi:hypothetical protein
MRMTPDSLRILAYAFALAGLGCFLWPLVQRLRGRDAPEAGGLSSPRWWAGFGLTALALMLQRMAAGG